MGLSHLRATSRAGVSARRFQPPPQVGAQDHVFSSPCPTPADGDGGGLWASYFDKLWCVGGGEQRERGNGKQLKRAEWPAQVETEQRKPSLAGIPPATASNLSPHRVGGQRTAVLEGTQAGLPSRLTSVCPPAPLPPRPADSQCPRNRT